MRFSYRVFLSACVVCLLFAAPSALFASVSLPIQFTFTGTCTDCLGTGTGVLTLQNYTPGDPLDASNFVDFTYTSNIFPSSSPFELTSASYLNGSIGASTGPYSVTIIGDGIFSSQQSSGDGESDWCLGNSCLADYGPSHTWALGAPAPASTPEPGTFALLGTGIAGVAGMRRKLRA